jgi:hypothetical protein
MCIVNTVEYRKHKAMQVFVRDWRNRGRKETKKIKQEQSGRERNKNEQIGTNRKERNKEE